MATPLMNPVTQAQTSALATNKVIRNTYTLLSMTLLFSAVTAGISMALNLLNAPQPVKVLIAGSGHVRNDYGVPIYLHQKNSHASIVAIGFQGVEKGITDVRDYARSWETAALPFDYLWLTQRARREDPCAGFRKQFSHKKQDK